VMILLCALVLCGGILCYEVKIEERRAENAAKEGICYAMHLCVIRCVICDL
jgi:hypothetical protein